MQTDTLSRYPASMHADEDENSDPQIREFYNVQKRLFIVDNMLTYRYEDRTPRLEIPKDMR